MTRPVVFMHIPKTSGIAVAHAVIAATGPGHVFAGFDRAFFGAFDDWASIGAENRAFVHLSPESLPAGQDSVRGHMSLSTLRAAYPAGRFMTVLREPFSRLLSHYVFWRGFTEEQHASWGGWGTLSALARRPLAEFLAEPRLSCQIDNVATRLLLWPHALIPDDGPIDPAHDAALLAAANARLAEFEFADCGENPELSANLGAWLGVAPRLEPHNVSPPMPPGLRFDLETALTSALQVQLSRLTRLDAALWRLVLEKNAPTVSTDQHRMAAIQRGIRRAAALLKGIP